MFIFGYIYNDRGGGGGWGGCGKVPRAFAIAIIGLTSVRLFGLFPLSDQGRIQVERG